MLTKNVNDTHADLTILAAQQKFGFSEDRAQRLIESAPFLRGSEMVILDNGAALFFQYETRSFQDGAEKLYLSVSVQHGDGDQRVAAGRVNRITDRALRADWVEELSTY
jgi:hypothetical protein